jgi:hypothetical protein
MTSAASTLGSSTGITAVSNPQPVVVPIFNQARLSPTSIQPQANTNTIDYPLGYMTEEEFLAKQHLQFSALLSSASVDNNNNIDMTMGLPSAGYEYMNDVGKVQTEDRYAKQEVGEDEDDVVEEIVEKVDDLEL